MYFGTGKYIETNDNSSSGQDTQTIYAVWDRDDPENFQAFTRDQLLQQEIIAQVGEQYVTSNKPIEWHEIPETVPTGTPPTSHLGWYIDLIVGGNNKGERQVTNPLVRDKRVIFNTTIPSSSPCDYGGTSNMIVLDAISGSRLQKSAFKKEAEDEFETVVEIDLDGDGQTDDLDGDGKPDGVDIDGDGVPDGVPPSSIPSKVGILSEPKFVEDLKAGEEHVAGLGTSGLPMIEEFMASSSTFGRQSWRQLLH